ncbi:hypothetical protein PHMEG_00015236 [Phytophthora megakarya]|uniref:Uncharacterized protein n=1 Tax=Phytophthora megakarya TaxID=4795 RepID=A0A225W3E7_9STRA|nr:hypothetical protein PHMEG_00015236 [Phytophthora megakarya]
MTTPKTADEIRSALDALELDVVASYYDGDDDEIDPYVICEGVSIDTFNEFVGDSEGLRIGLRFLALDDGRIVIVDFPTRVHESTAEYFKIKFLTATGNPDEVGSGGSMTASITGRRNKEADATFGPKYSTPNRTAPPAFRTVADWVTLAVEIGRFQSWRSLEEAAEWWCDYNGVQYILLLKISPTCIQMQYALYSIAALGTLPAPTTTDTLYFNSRDEPDGAISFDMHRILSIPLGQALPFGVNEIAHVDLRVIMDLVIDDIRV